MIYHAFGNVPSLHWIIPTMTPNNPKALPKISTTKIFTKESGFCASAIAQPLPDTPTQILYINKFVPAEQVWNTHWHSCPKQRISAKHHIIWILEISFNSWSWENIDFSLQNDCHDDSVNSNGFTKDDAKLEGLYLTKFFDRIRGALTAAPRMVAPVMKIPLK